MANPPQFPDYNVLAKWDTPSWDDVTRNVVAARLAVVDEPIFFDEAAWAVLKALCDSILPQTGARPRVPLAAYVDRKCADDARDGYRDARLPPLRRAWTRGLSALDAESRSRNGLPFAQLTEAERTSLVAEMQSGNLADPAWDGMPPELFFSDRVVHDIARAYYAHPTGWSEIGFGGPASPRGYVRLGFGQRDPWEAS